MRDKYIIGVDLGGTKIATAIATLQGKILRRVNIPTFAENGPKIVIACIIDTINTVIAAQQVNSKEVEVIGLSVPGQVDAEKGKVLNAPNLYGWNNVPLRKKLKKHFDCRIIIDNDANAAAIGEYQFGAGTGRKNMVFITISTGIGSGLILNGKLYHGKNNSSGEIGHISVNPSGPECSCGNKGCLEAYASGPSMANRAIRLLTENLGNPDALALIHLADANITKITAKLLGKAAQIGDKFSLDIIKESCYFIGIGIVNIIKILNPELIVIGGGVSMIGDIFFNEITAIVKKHCTINPENIPPIVPAKLGTDAGIIGTIALGM